jgi:DNA adenine methylase
MPDLEPPFPFSGGKRQIAEDIWDWLGDPKNYLEPFFGGGSVLLNRPHPPSPDSPKAETVNDANGYIVNFWRATQHDPASVAEVVKQPIHEMELHSRRQWLIEQGGEEFSKQLKNNANYYDAEIAGWWVWGACIWIGNQWPWAEWEGKPRLSEVASSGLLSLQHRNQPEKLLNMISDRLRHVRVIYGDWTRTVSSKSMLKGPGTPCAIFLDPPYSSSFDRQTYGADLDDSDGLPEEVYTWCETHGEDPDLRIAVCGYTQNWDPPESWYEMTWTTQGGWARKSDDPNPDAQKEECVWFSPHCIDPHDDALPDDHLLSGVV